MTADIAPYSLNVLSLCRGYHFSVHVVVADLKVSIVEGFDFQMFSGGWISRPGLPGD